MQVYDIINISSNQLPELIKQLHHPIKDLKGRGNTTLLSKGKRVGIVGARKFTPYGRRITQDISTALAKSGVTVVSGLALGVDSIAHQACLEARGKTIAVLPSGFKKIYPSSHNSLANRILENEGLLLSEYPLDHVPRKFDFIERNRIIASISDLLVVTEAATASGSLHTASFALELGVTVMAVPGNIDSPYSAGTNKLIQNGAFALLDPQDILEQLGITQSDAIEYLPENETEALIIDGLSSTGTSAQELADITNLPADELAMQLTLLEIKGVISIGNGLWKLK